MRTDGACWQIGAIAKGFLQLKVELFTFSVSTNSAHTIQETWYRVKISFVTFHLKTLSEIIAMAAVVTAAVL